MTDRATALRLVSVLPLAIGIWAAAAQGAATHFRYERAATPAARGANRLPVDVPLLAGAKPLEYAGSVLRGGLEDLRLFDPSGHEVGYLVIPPPAPSERWQSGDVLPVQATDETSGFEVDLGTAVRIDRLRLADIPPPFLKRLRLEGSGDREHWVIPVDAGTVFDLPQEGLKRTEIAFPPTELRYLRITWDDRNSAVVPPPRKVAAHLAIPALSVETMRVPLGFARRPSEPGVSRFRVHLPGSRLPIVALELSCGGGHLSRQARVSEARLSGTEALPAVLGSRTLQRALRGQLVADDLRIPIMRPQSAELELEVGDGDNPPIDLLTIEAELAPLPWIYFESVDGASLTARFGEVKLDAPHYDLEAMRESAAAARAAEARWGEMRDASPPAEDQSDRVSDDAVGSGAAIDTGDFAYRRAIGEGPTGLTAVVLDAAVLAHSGNLFDLRIVDASDRQVSYLVESLGEPLQIELEELWPVVAATPGQDRRQSRYRLTFPYDTLPAARLVLTTTGRVFDRSLRVRAERRPRDARSEPRWEEVASVRWRHADAEERSADLVINLPALGTAQAELIVDEGDNSPLPIARPRLLLPAYRLRFFRVDGADLTLLYGAPKLGPPRYDLALLAPRVLSATAHEVHVGPEATMTPAASASVITQAKLFWGALVLAIIVLLALIVRLVGKNP